MVSFIEWIVGIVPVMLIAAAMKNAPLFASWSFAQVLLLLLLPAGLIHWAILCQYLKLRAEPGASEQGPR
jgi:hypothetical protein